MDNREETINDFDRSRAIFEYYFDEVRTKLLEMSKEWNPTYDDVTMYAFVNAKLGSLSNFLLFYALVDASKEAREYLLKMFIITVEESLKQADEEENG